MKAKPVSVVLLFIIINCQWSKCDSVFENDRSKRTVGVFFKNFVDAFQTQRQPAPNVVSFKPTRQQKPQSIKADIFSSSKTLFQQKQNIFKPPAATTTPATTTATIRAPDKQVMTTPPPAPAPAAPAPQAPAEPITQVPMDPPETNPPTSPVEPPLDPFTNLMPPAGHHPLTPFKAQLLILPFQGHHGSATPFAGFGTQPHLGSGISPFSYQAQIYLQPPVGGIFPPSSTEHYPGRYSPHNGWHDVDEILSKGVQNPIIKTEKGEVGIDEYTKLKNIELNKYEGEIKSETDGSKYIENPTSVGPLPYHNGEQHENNIENLRRDGHFRNYYGGELQHITSNPLFFPQFSYSNFNANPYSDSHGVGEGSNHHDHKIPSFQQEEDEDCKKIAAEALKNIKVQSPTTLSPQNNQDRPRVNDAGVLQIRDWSENTNLGLNFTPQLGTGKKLNENSHEEKHDHQQNYNHNQAQNQFYYPEHNQLHYPELYNHYPSHEFVFLPEGKQAHHPEHPNIHFQDSFHHPEQIYQNFLGPNHYTYPNSYEKDHIQEGHAKIRQAPSSRHQPRNRYSHSHASFHKPHQPVPAHGPPSYHTEITDSHPNGYYHFKRSYT